MKLPSGISSAPEHFQNKTSQLIDTVVANGVLFTLSGKSQFALTEIHFLGHIINSQGRRAGPIKLIIHMPEPKDVADVCHFKGMVNVSPHLPHLTVWLKTDELHLGSSPTEGVLGNEESFGDCVSQHSPFHIAMVSADASSYGMGSISII